MRRWSSIGGAVLLLVLLLPLSGQPAAGEEKAAAAGQQGKAGSGASLVDSLSFTSRKEPIHIRSRDLEFRYDDKRITYRGDVVVTQGETVLKSDTLIVTYEEPATEKGATQPKPDNTSSEKGAAQPKPQNTSSQQQIKEIVAEGKVDITSGDRHATAKKAVFTQATRTVVLSGNAVLQEGENRVAGEKVTVFLDEKRTVVEGGGEKPRVEMVVSQQQEGGKKEKKPRE
jgi:lipopolysaccharide export system protein LptA